MVSRNAHLPGDSSTKKVQEMVHWELCTELSKRQDIIFNIALVAWYPNSDKTGNWNPFHGKIIMRAMLPQTQQIKGCAISIGIKKDRLSDSLNERLNHSLLSLAWGPRTTMVSVYQMHSKIIIYINTFKLKCLRSPCNRPGCLV
jgi:hypothetical protein